MTPFQQKLAQRMRSLRKSAGLTQSQVAQILHVARSTYASYESAVICPNHIAIRRLAKMYRVTANYLLGMKELQEGENRVASADSGDLLTAATPEEKQCLLTFRILAPEEQASLLAAAQRILDGGGRTEK